MKNISGLAIVLLAASACDDAASRIQTMDVGSPVIEETVGTELLEGTPAFSFDSEFHDFGEITEAPWPSIFSNFAIQATRHYWSFRMPKEVAVAQYLTGREIPSLPANKARSRSPSTAQADRARTTSRSP